MNINEWLRLIAGLIILISISLAAFVNPAWLWLTAFVALNLIQSAFSKWCPMLSILRKLGVKEN